MANLALALTRVTHRFGDLVAVDDVSLDVAHGEILCLLGPSGCGKSTLLRLAAGLEKIQAGQVRIENIAVADADRGIDLPPNRRDVGLVFQDYALFPHLTVEGNVAFGLRQLDDAAREARVRDALAQVGMAEFARAFPHTLSGGQQQRVALARALCPQPHLMLLDEPFSGLDARLRHRVADETWRLLKAAGTATVIVTHDPEEAMFMGDRIAVMRAGRIVQIGPPHEVYAQPRSAFVTAFLSDVNRLEAVVDAHGMAATALGPVCAPGFAAGARVEVLVRHAGVQVDIASSAASNNACTATVIYARPLGVDWLVHLRTTGAAGAANVYGRYVGQIVPNAGQGVALRIDPAHIFVFAAEPDRTKSAPPAP
ncbi:MAG: ABC transporter ATP-binding protein [Alphaproteobacteria bacterium]